MELGIYQRNVSSANLFRVPHNEPVGRELLKLLRIPVDEYDDVVRLLQLDHYSSVISLLNYKGRTQATSYVLQNMVENVSRFEGITCYFNFRVKS